MTETLLLMALMLLAAGMAAQGQPGVAPPDQFGLTCVGSAYFPAPDGAEQSPVPDGGFEAGGEGWQIAGGEVAAGDAPEGVRYLALTAGETSLRSPRFQVRGNRPHLASMWLRADQPLRMVVQTDSPDREVKVARLDLPATGGAWKRVGVYFRAPLAATWGELVLARDRDGQNPAFALDDLRLRAAPEEEMSRAYDAWRAQYPARDLSPRPADGAHLALTIAKLSGRDWPPDRPFRIFAIGSSYTNFLGVGETLIQQIRRRFPGAPEIEYRKHVGSATPYEFIAGWVRTLVIPAQPDLVLVYADGQPEGLETILRDLRTHTTADIIVPSLHLRQRDEEVSDATINDPHWDRVRGIAERFGAEWVDSRREWGAYVREHDLGLGGLLMDAVHQTEHGALVINENIARHLVANPAPAYDPAQRERRLTPDDDAVTLSADGHVRVQFTGNRINLVGRRVPDGGTAHVLIDGVPAEETPAFRVGFIEPNPRNAHGPDRAADRAPHAVELGENLVPQEWTIVVTSAEGDFTLTGSVTGADGARNSGERFVSTSGQIIIDPTLWRRSDRNEPGDVFTFTVERTTVAEVNFAGEPGLFRLQLADALTNGPHVVELAPEGPIAVEAFEVFTPPGG